jgi:hypothetical protein
VNVTVSTRASIALKQDEPVIETGFEQCIPSGCFESFPAADDAVKRLRGAVRACPRRYNDAPEKGWISILAARARTRTRRFGEEFTQDATFVLKRSPKSCAVRRKMAAGASLAGSCSECLLQTSYCGIAFGG